MSSWSKYQENSHYCNYYNVVLFRSSYKFAHVTTAQVFRRVQIRTNCLFARNASLIVALLRKVPPYCSFFQIDLTFLENTGLSFLTMEICCIMATLPTDMFYIVTVGRCGVWCRGLLAWPYCLSVGWPTFGKAILNDFVSNLWHWYDGERLFYHHISLYYIYTIILIAPCHLHLSNGI